jgi:hypothetical protein
MIKLTQDFDKDFIFLTNRIFFEKKPTYFSRYADGELALMLGKEIPSFSQASLQDKWTAPPNKTLLGKDLTISLKNTNPNKVYAISCGCCDSFAKKVYLDNLKIAGVNIENITFSNLWINGNYEKFKNVIDKQITEKVVLIANVEGSNKNYPFDLYEFFSVQNDCVNFWQSKKNDFILELNKHFSKYTNTLFLISAGPMSEVIIESLITINQSNRYIDVGSALDEYTKGRKTRPYMQQNQLFFQKKCIF